MLVEPSVEADARAAVALARPRRAGGCGGYRRTRRRMDRRGVVTARAPRRAADDARPSHAARRRRAGRRDQRAAVLVGRPVASVSSRIDYAELAFLISNPCRDVDRVDARPVAPPPRVGQGRRFRESVERCVAGRLRCADGWRVAGHEPPPARPAKGRLARRLGVGRYDQRDEAERHYDERCEGGECDQRPTSRGVIEIRRAARLTCSVRLQADVSFRF